MGAKTFQRISLTFFQSLSLLDQRAGGGISPFFEFEKVGTKLRRGGVGSFISVQLILCYDEDGSRNFSVNYSYLILN